MAISNQQLYDLMMRVYQRQERLSFDEVVPSSVSVVAGTLVTGDAASLAQRDKTYLQVSEVVADPGLRVDITFSSTAGAVPHTVSLIGRYEGGPTHHMDVLAYNVNTLGWDDLSAVETLEMLNQSADDILYEYHLSPELIAGDGTVIIRLDHDPTTRC